MANSKGLIPADVINEIKYKNDIVNYISSKQSCLNVVRIITGNALYAASWNPLLYIRKQTRFIALPEV